MLQTQLLALRKSISLLIDKCNNIKQLKQIHAQILTSFVLPPNDQYFLITRLLFFSALSGTGSLGYATDIFGSIENPNLYVYNIMIRAYACQINCIDQTHLVCSLMLYKQMLCDGIMPNCLTFPFLIKECSKSHNCRTGRSIHAQVVKLGLYNDVFVHNSLISLYSSCGVLTNAQKVFDEMLQRDIVSWNSMVVGYLRNGELDAALGLFRRMEKKNIITWNSIITGFVQGGRPKEALEFFHEMQIISNEIIKPDKITIANVLSACTYLGAIDHGKWVHDYLTRSGLECDLVISTALIDMYGKCGCVEQAYKVFERMPKKDTLAWTAMISVFALNGLGEDALNLFEEMQLNGVMPNQVTFVGLLSGCAHSGLVEKGWWCFQMMRCVYLIEPELHHYACMVGILGKAGLLEEAEELIKSMPMKSDVFVWGALIGGCQMHGNVDLGERVSQYLIDMEPLNHAFYVNLCDIYAKAGRFNDAKRIRSLMVEKGIKKEVPGCSTIEIDGIVFEFSVKGSSEVAMEEVVWIVNRLSYVMKVKWDIDLVRI